MARLHVGMDVSPLVLTRAGTARHIDSLLARLREEPGLELRTYRFGGRSRALVPLRDVGWYLGVLPALARRDRLDVLHCPTFRAPTRSRVPLVVTFHDLAVLRHAHAFNRWTRAYSGRLLRRVAAAATRIIAVSEFTKREVVELLSVPQHKVRVIPNAVGFPFVPDGPAAEGDYVLAVSTLEPRKNLARVVDGFRRARLGGCELRIVGARGWGGVKIDAERGVRWLGEVTDDELARLYRGARCVAYVSLYEGFGLPVLEAMASGAPVVTARGVTAVGEVAGDAAVLVDPLDPDAIAAGLVEAMERRDELVASGLARAAAFDWRAVASATVDVYR
ncbi:MAG: glycosyltransferase family 4 protein, partial [Actinomycetota bacterium]|nr:glycosyltransferase family 4 protein [Actinomycetota bacterium]